VCGGVWAAHCVLQGMRDINRNSVATLAAGVCGYNTLTMATTTTLTPNSFNLQKQLRSLTLQSSRLRKGIMEIYLLNEQI